MLPAPADLPSGTVLLEVLTSDGGTAADVDMDQRSEGRRLVVKKARVANGSVPSATLSGSGKG
eukprot:15203029-Alexandrium_andersonii.AAC.1